MILIGRLVNRLFALPTPTREQILKISRDLYGPCMLCGKGLTGHDLAELASVIVEQTESRRSEILDSTVQKRDWVAASQFKEWRGDADEIIYSLIRCPLSDQFYMARVESFAAMGSDDRVTAREALTVSESAQVAACVNLAWHALTLPPN